MKNILIAMGLGICTVFLAVGFMWLVWTVGLFIYHNTGDAAPWFGLAALGAGFGLVLWATIET